MDRWQEDAARLEAYVEGRFQASGRTAFPTVRQCAKACRLTQKRVLDMAEDVENLQLTYYRSVEFEVPDGDWFVETINEPGTGQSVVYTARRPRAYGAVELAAAVGASAAAVHVWLHRGSHGIPEPDVRLACGPVWFPGGPIDAWIAAWIKRRKAGACAAL